MGFVENYGLYLYYNRVNQIQITSAKSQHIISALKSNQSNKISISKSLLWPLIEIQEKLNLIWSLNWNIYQSMAHTYTHHLRHFFTADCSSSFAFWNMAEDWPGKCPIWTGLKCMTFQNSISYLTASSHYYLTIGIITKSGNNNKFRW